MELSLMTSSLTLQKTSCLLEASDVPTFGIHFMKYREVHCKVVQVKNTGWAGASSPASKNRHVRFTWAQLPELVEEQTFLTTVVPQPDPWVSSAPGQGPSRGPHVHGSIVFGCCLCARCCFLLFSSPRIKSVLNRPIDSYFVATSQKHFYIVEYGGILVIQKTELSLLFCRNSKSQFVIYY